MDIYELINKRKDTLIYGTSNIVNESYNDYIDDPEKYIESALQEFTDETMAIVGEMYVNELIFEDAMMYCEDEEYVQEALFDEEFQRKNAEKVADALKSTESLGKKFAKFIQSLIDKIISFFSPGERLIRKYEKQIREAYKEKGNKIKVKCYRYKYTEGDIEKLLSDISLFMTLAYDAIAGKKGEITEERIKQVIASNTNTDGSVESIKNAATYCVRVNSKEGEYRVSDLPIDDIIDFTANKNKYIKIAKNINSNFQKRCSHMTTVLKSKKPLERNELKILISGIKQCSTLSSAATISFVNEVKQANRSYTAICKKLISGKVDDPEK